MELKCQKRGVDNHVFDLEEGPQTYTEVDSSSYIINNDDDDDAQKTNEEEDVKSQLNKKMEAVQELWSKHTDSIHLCIRLLLAAGVVAIVIAACVLNFRRALGLLVLFLVTVFFLLWDWMMERYGNRAWEQLHPIRELLSRNQFWIKWVLYASALLALVLWLALDTVQQGIRQIMSFCGLLFFICFIIVFSKHPCRWSPQTLVCGIGLQFVFGLLTLRSGAGLSVLEVVGTQVEVFMSYADVGSEFVFGESYRDHFFVFQVMPIVIFLSSCISVLYYLGFMQWLICKLGFIMQVAMGTSPAESMASAGNIFLGQTEAPLLIKPYLSQLTLSEIHAVMTGGFANISGSILGAFISFGIEGSHLLIASLMSAPASLAVAKTFWPETETPVPTSDHVIKSDRGESKNLLEAASNGACGAVSVVGSIVANILSFMALLAFVDAVLSWFGGMFDCPQLSFSLICSYVFMPIAFLMGVSWEDSFMVAELLGIKTFLNEVVAYQELSEMIKRREEGGPEYVDGVKQYISVQSEVIATYALCGFSNFASLGMTIGAMTAMTPERRADISACGLRSLMAGSISCLMSACVAGMLYIPDAECPQFLSAEFSKANVTNSTQLITCCTMLYNSVTVYEPWNMTVGGGFSVSSLQGCCSLAPPTHFNCSSMF